MHFHGYCFSCLVSCLPVLSRQEECFEETNAVQLNLQNCIFELYLIIVSTFMLKDKHAERTGAHFCVNCLLQNLNEVWGFECAYMYIALCHLSYQVYKTCWSGSRKSGVLPSFLLFSFGCYYLSMKMMMMIIIMIRRCKTRLDERSTSQDRSGLCVGRVFLEKTWCCCCRKLRWVNYQ